MTNSELKNFSNILLIISIISFVIGITFLSIVKYKIEDQIQGSLFGIGFIFIGGFTLISATLMAISYNSDNKL